MTKTKLFWRRQLCMLFCVFLIFSAVFPPAYADSAIITSTNMYSYFQTFSSQGQWVDIQTPAHWITDTGEVAYCLQTSKDNPYNANYYTIDGELVYDDYVLTGLRAILNNGYPADSGGFDDQAARYATANAIRFWMAENYCDGMPQYLNLNVNGDWIRGKPGFEDLFDWSLYLLGLARSQSVNPINIGSLAFSPTEIMLSQDPTGQYFTGTVYLNKAITGDYSLMDNSPDSALIINGHTGVQSETLTLAIPAQYANQEFLLCAYGMDDAPSARLFFWQPDSWNNQRLITYVLDSTESVFVRGFLTIKTPSASVQPQKGNLQITKTDESGQPLSGVSFTLYDSGRNEISTLTTDSSGVVTFANLPLGNYYYAETAALSGYVLDDTLYPISITQNGQVVSKTVTNSLSKGSLKLIKIDESGNPIASTGFCLYDSSGTRIKSGSTDSSGVLIFSDLHLGDYYYQESFAIPGYALDDTMYPVSITEAGQVVTKTVVNSKSAGTVKILKTDAETGEPLQGAEFTLMDSTYREVAVGTSDESGLVTFSGLTLGYYFIQETNAPPGYVPYGHIDQILLDSNGKVISKTYTNTPARGSLKIIKKNDGGEVLSGVEFKLYDADRGEIDSGVTDENGILLFENLLVGDYFISEVTELPGYIPSHDLRSARVGYHGAVEEIIVTNYAAHGHIRIIKVDEAGNPLAGVHFKLTDTEGNLVNEGDTGADGKLIFTMLPVGRYFVQETATVNGYVLDDTPIPVELTRDGEVVTKTVTNGAALGSIVVMKTDAVTGAPLSGVHFVLTDSSGSAVGGGGTDENGVLTFSGLPLGTYTLMETETRNGYVLDSSPITITLDTSGQTVEKSITNTPACGSVLITKTDAESGAALAGAHFVLRDEAGALCAEGDTGTDGTLTLPNIPVGVYILRETATVTGYVLDETPINVSIIENGQVVTVNATNTIARGGVVIMKTDSKTGEALAGVHFKLFDAAGSLVAEGDTGADGKLTLSGLPLGSYTLKETVTKDGYALDQETIPVEITENGQSVEISVTNTPLNGSLEIVKKDAHDADILLMGAGYRLYDSTGAQIAEGYTDAFGKLTFPDLPCGSYKYKEFKAPKGFTLDETEYSVEISTRELNVSHTREDTRRTGMLQVTKKSADGSLLQGAAFLLEFSTDNGSTWQPVSLRDADSEATRGGCTSEGLVNGQLMTGENGRVRFEGLRADGLILYRVTETVAPEGHSLIGGTLYSGTLPVESENIYANDAEVFDNRAFVYSVFVTAVDDPLYRLPDAGGSGFAHLPFAMLLCAACIMMFKKKLKNERSLAK